MAWLELSVNATYEAVDWVKTQLSATDYIHAIEITTYTSSESVPSTNQDEAWEFTLRFYFPDNTEANTRLEKVSNLLSSLSRTGLTSALQIAVVKEKPTDSEAPLIHRIGNRFVILPPDISYQSESSTEIPIQLGKTLSFGSGLHPATVLILKLIERYVAAPMHALDLGCGSGILSVAMAKLGATVLALDNDRIAVEATQDALVRNGVDHQVTVMEGSLGQGSGMGHWMGLNTIEAVPTIEPTAAFDVIAANILGRMHMTLAQDYRKALRQTDCSTGLLITSGFTTDYETELNKAFTEAGFEAVDCERFNEWIALAHRLKD
jgi:ribosomal protein L11 methyltransferase